MFALNQQINLRNVDILTNLKCPCFRQTCKDFDWFLTLFWSFFFLPIQYSLKKEFCNSNPKVDSFFPFLMVLQFCIKTFTKSLDQSYFPSFAELFWTYYFYFSKIWSFSKNVFKVDLSVSNLQRFCVPEDILNWLSHLNYNLIECIK